MNKEIKSFNLRVYALIIEQESILDTWVIWGSKWKLKYIWGYQSLPQIKQLYKDCLLYTSPSPRDRG